MRIIKREKALGKLMKKLRWMSIPGTEVEVRKEVEKRLERLIRQRLGFEGKKLEQMLNILKKEYRKGKIARFFVLRKLNNLVERYGKDYTYVFLGRDARILYVLFRKKFKGYKSKLIEVSGNRVFYDYDRLRRFQEYLKKQLRGEKRLVLIDTGVEGGHLTKVAEQIKAALGKGIDVRKEIILKLNDAYRDVRGLWQEDEAFRYFGRKNWDLFEPEHVVKEVEEYKEGKARYKASSDISRVRSIAYFLGLMEE